MKHTLTLITTLIASASLHAAPKTHVDHLVQNDAKPVLAAPLVDLEKMLTVNSTHLIVQVSNAAKGPSSSILLGIYHRILAEDLPSEIHLESKIASLSSDTNGANFATKSFTLTCTAIKLGINDSDLKMIEPRISRSITNFQK